MIQLTFHDRTDETMVALEMTDLRLTSGVLWSSLDHGLIARYVDGTWKHRGRNYPSLGIVGAACLVFGIAREPSLISEPIGHFSITGPIFRANGVPVARYVELRDMWQGLMRPLWWTALRIVSAEGVSAWADDSAQLLNPWDPDPGQPHLMLH